MKKRLTYEYLWQVELDISHIRDSSPALWLFNETRFTKFLLSRDTQMNLKIMHERVQEIQKRFIEHDEEGQPRYADETRSAWLFKASATTVKGLLVTGVDVQQAYRDEWEGFMHRSIDLDI